MPLDLDRVIPRLYQGGAIDPSRSYRPFSMIVLCAVEHQPELPRFKGVLLHPAFDDTKTPTPAELARARSAARAVAVEWRRGGSIAVTCAMGWNRSGLVTGLALNRLTSDWDAAQVIAAIRRARGPNALGNPTFARLIHECNRHEGCKLC